MEGNTPIDFDLRSGSAEIQASVTTEKNVEVSQEQITSPSILLTKEKPVEKADASRATKKKRGRPKKKKIEGLPKLDDANEAGGPRASECTLILTEGDSAKTLAVSGLSVVGRDLYGVYPLRGKPLNVRDANLPMVQKNEELMAIVKIMNLEFGKEYDDVSSLRYGHLMIMADQDHDGSHIKGLIINFIHFFWPSLLKIPGFLLEFVTPIVRAKKDKEVVSFYSTNEYNAWKEKNDTTGWSFKYYKGLGTSTFAEAKQYFSALDKHIKEFVYDGAADDYAIDLAFSRRKADERRIWLSEYEEGTGLDELLAKIPFSEFINKELIQFSLADCKRCIPSIMDGLKPGQRKVLYGCFKRDLTSSLRVAQLSGYIAETALYHHGECSLQNTIVGMAQTFVGSNNINLLEPEGQFGTRLHGGKDSASPRYIYTKLSPLTRKLFHPADDKLVKYIEEEGTSIEPEWYVPIIPMVLVNGTAGIGTGWSSVIPNYNPRDIVDIIRRMMKNEPLQQMTPWYRGFKGTIQWNPAKNCFVSQAVWRRVDDETLEITELVVQYWTSSFKEYLDKASSLSSEVVVKNVADSSTDTMVNFTVTIPGLKDISDDQLVKDLRLETKITTSNMHLYDAEGKIKKYDTPEQIIEEFYPVRLKFYEQRKAAIVADQIAYLQRLENKLKFLELVGDGKLKVYRRSRADVLSDMAQLGLDPMVDENGSDRSTPSYEYLLSIPINALTLEDIQALEAEYQLRRTDLAKVCDTTPEQFWETDLKLFLEALEEYERERDLDKPKTKKKQKDF